MTLRSAFLPTAMTPRSPRPAALAVSEVRRRTSSSIGQRFFCAAPVGQQPGRIAGVEDEADMGAAVAEPHDDVPVGQHLLGAVEAVVRIVRDRAVDEVAAAVLDQDVVGELGRA